MTPQTSPWWKSQTGYQIYPRSFCDSNADGIGDLPGITSKLDHLAELGIGFIWLSPIYASPMRDNGYDISNYHEIAPDFGTLSDFDDLLAQAGQRGIRIVMDLVVNHCSSDHDWFQRACESVDHPEHKYFYWREAREDGSPPDDQPACFGGSAWTWVAAVGKYYYGHFGPQQPDFNWQNPALRARIFEMMNWWLDKGIGGFRIDVVDLIGKDIDARLYHEGPDMLTYLSEMQQACFAGRDIVTVGESWAATPDSALSFCGRDSGALDMVFNFNHIQAMWDPEKGRFGRNQFDLVTHKMIMNDWQLALESEGWNSLYLSNHDLPRAVSVWGDEGGYRRASAKMLGLVTHFMKGTPFVYQGEEIAMTNTRFERLEQFRDIETLGQFRDRVEAGEDPSHFLGAANANGRDTARTPLQWDAGDHAGFSTVTPWIAVNPNYPQINVAAEKAAPDGVFDFYRRMIALRQTCEPLVDGRFELIEAAHPALFCYLRHGRNQTILVVANFTATPQAFDAAPFADQTWRVLLSNEAADDHPSGAVGAFGASAWITES